MNKGNQGLRIGIAMMVVVGVIAWLAITGVEANKSYYVTISELQAMGSKAYTRHLRVAGNVLPGTIARSGTNADFVLVENDKKLHVAYIGEEPPPDTFKDNSQALAIGTFGHDGVFHATQLQAKCASKYAPKNTPGQPGDKPAVAATNAAAVMPAMAAK
ncbi:cytochrome c maturation protein CcmE [Paracidobacterium acidisoli]|uniref:Cytochrome c maturation protein CcmE n=1 Tax=Paracidobacterium acidisoli TaxID=2303751 RepID=A0A372ISF7_9BACT|nr:cytochrome c maturation protein CcmE [Paracidobacterium acidisoli]MBT9330754.1 cytochrome c maturation protein CcmE [Paracidobacterium acidisoli]